jgi:hypothetical protein
MSKLKEKLSKWFLDMAKKLDENTVNDNCTTIQLPSSTQPIIMYDTYHIEKIHAQHMMSDATLDAYRLNLSFDVDDMIRRRLIDEISKVIYDSHKDDVKKTLLADSPYNPSTLFTLDVYVCKPQKKESLL